MSERVSVLVNGDEVLLPAPDYPLRTAPVSIPGPKPTPYPRPTGASCSPRS